MESIQDLINASKGSSAPKKGGDESAQGVLAKKQEEIKIKEVERLTQKKAAVVKMPYINLFGFPIGPESISLISEEDSIRLKTVCFYYDGRAIKIGTNKMSEEVKELAKELDAKYYAKTEIYFISEHSLKYALDFYKTIPKVEKAVIGVEIKQEDLEKYKNEIVDYKSLGEKISKVNISDVVVLIIATALKTNCSDIHIEAEDFGIVVRLRIDGVLQEAAVIEKDKWPRIISRMKLMAGVKMNITDKPQDGRYTIFLGDEKISVRSSFLPTNYGESVVMRLAKSSAINLSFEDLGLMKGGFEVLNREIQKPNGLVLVTGPTGSGKTTTLYAVLNKLNKPGVKIVTLEDPIEYQLGSINQSQVDASKGYTFAKGLRSILRQDPDIVMVGEIRDLETAEIAIQASLTGHLVLSTLHTNDAAGVIPRLIDMGVQPYFIPPAINAIVAQRLVRKLCPQCRVEHVLTAEEESLVNKILAVISPKANLDVPTKLPAIYKPGKGCDHCGGVGYRGRLGIYEIFTMSDDIKELTAESAPAFKILQQAIENGMVTMLQDGILKVLKGVTSLDEVYRVIGKFDYIETLYRIVASSALGDGMKVSPEMSKNVDAIISDLSKTKEAILSALGHEKLELIIAAGIKAEAGDIHIDPMEDGVSIRFRIDGILHDIAVLEKEHYIPILTKVKNLSNIVSNIKKPTYDGRFGVSIDEKKIDCRVSIISGAYGETVVIRVLEGNTSLINMEKLGINSINLERINRAIKKTQGIIITTGPTGSGKTTTLYSIIKKLNKPEVKIITVEDPIEVRMEGVMQTQIDSEAGYTFASALRSLMRQNPNIIMIGEIRDPETAKISIEAAQTGHLVLSTIHASGAAGAIDRLSGLDIERQALADSIEMIIGQRLVRRLCPYCKTEVELSDENMARVKDILEKTSPVAGVDKIKELKFYGPVGCEKCASIGYKGRVGIYEVIEMTPEMQKIIQMDNATDNDIEAEAIKQGALLMIQDGILKALAGDTSVEEIFKATG